MNTPNKPSIIIIFPFILAALFSCSLSATNQTSGESIPTTRDEWHKLLNWDDNCEAGVQHLVKADIGFVGVKQYTLNNKAKLITVICRSAAYNRGLITFIKSVDDTQYRLITFPQIGSTDSTDKPIKSRSGFYRYTDRLLWGHVKIDTKHNRVTNRNLFRGGGGCGIVNEYTINNGQVELTAFSAYNNCDRTNLPVDQWPKYTKAQWSTWPRGEKPTR